METKDIKDYTYSEAVGELEKLLRAMESENCDIDKLASYTERSIELLKMCRQRLHSVDEKVQRTIQELQPEA